ncbi:longitudinals lacking protein, isoforms A/B/D/L isoform X4 [Atheta coriaria]|uniref:longitudinals lacking protein, isoforms A/B/D/L isoform X4 n=1 Tax=Dalotia coriaria TaxID=877792 RepID=UPI0031F45464
MDDDQQFCLRWNNHQSTLIAVFDTLLENGTLVDCTLAAEGKFLNAHKVVLSACSPYFESLLSQNYDKHPIFILKDIKYQELKAMMDYMYRGEVNISQDQLGALLKAAESLQIKGLSDNRKGETETKKSVLPPPPAKSPPPTASLPKVQGLTIEHRRKDSDENSRDGSQSPGPRRRKRARRRSEEIENNHDASNSSESHHSVPPQNIPITPPTKVTDVPEALEKQEILTRHKVSESEIPPQVPKENIETHSELMLEPKAEYMDEMNEDSIEDLTLDDEELSNMEQMDEGAGPSHGNVGEASGQGFGWHMGNQSQDEVFLAAQEAVGAHRDSQALPMAIQLTEYEPLEIEFTNSPWFLVADKPPKKQVYNRIRGNFKCSQCDRTYIRKDSLQRHLNYECGKEPQFQCPFCPQKCKRKSHQIRHIKRQHKDKIGILEENNPGLNISKDIKNELDAMDDYNSDIKQEAAEY